MPSLRENFNNFLFYLEKVRAYTSSTIATYIKALPHQLHHSFPTDLLQNGARKKLNEYSKIHPLCQKNSQ